MKVKLLDTFTGETCIVDERSDEDGSLLYDAWWWAEGNGSCDCNREKYFNVDNPNDGICLGGVRFLIIEADTYKYTLGDLNSDYPDELLKKHGIEPRKPTKNKGDCMEEIEPKISADIITVTYPIQVDTIPVPCRGCGKNMKGPKGVIVSGAEISIIDSQNDPEMTEFLQLQMGDLALNEKYRFCCECWIKSLMFWGEKQRENN